MGFKIDSIGKLNSSADTLLDYASKLETEKNKVVGALDELKNIISGSGVRESFDKLSSAIANESQNASVTLDYVSEFIKTQTAGYATTVSNASSTLNNVQSTLDGISEI